MIKIFCCYVELLEAVRIKNIIYSKKFSIGNKFNKYWANLFNNDCLKSLVPFCLSEYYSLTLESEREKETYRERKKERKRELKRGKVKIFINTFRGK